MQEIGSNFARKQIFHEVTTAVKSMTAREVISVSREDFHSQIVPAANNRRCI